jgi:hypothetical protein
MDDYCHNNDDYDDHHDHDRISASLVIEQHPSMRALVDRHAAAVASPLVSKIVTELNQLVNDGDGCKMVATAATAPPTLAGGGCYDETRTTPPALPASKGEECNDSTKVDAPTSQGGKSGGGIGAREGLWQKGETFGWKKVLRLKKRQKRKDKEENEMRYSSVIPMLALVIGGGNGTLVVVCASLIGTHKQKTLARTHGICIRQKPVVVVVGSGRVADVLTKFHRRWMACLAEASLLYSDANEEERVMVHQQRSEWRRSLFHDQWVPARLSEIDGKTGGVDYYEVEYTNNEDEDSEDKDSEDEEDSEEDDDGIAHRKKQAQQHRVYSPPPIKQGRSKKGKRKAGKSHSKWNQIVEYTKWDQRYTTTEDKEDGQTGKVHISNIRLHHEGRFLYEDMSPTAREERALPLVEALTVFYTAHDPHEVSNIAKIIALYPDLREMEERLRKKYGQGPDILHLTATPSLLRSKLVPGAQIQVRCQSYADKWQRTIMQAFEQKRKKRRHETEEEIRHARILFATYLSFLRLPGNHGKVCTVVYGSLIVLVFYGTQYSLFAYTCTLAFSAADCTVHAFF